ncbi:heat-inducible transcription repressor HrcA [candidate division KSB1 bacterium]|nr:heat-inducible transcription repressor HrcA [candidate division KSB1 bacterium]
MEQELTNREIQILDSIIKNFVIKAAPVGSRAVAKEHDYSPATIRNVMMDLEDKGFILQPHISAGRVPTDKGYRYYVDGIMKIEELTANEKQQIKQQIGTEALDIDKILEKSCQALCKISNLLGVVLSPRFFSGKFKKLELVKLSENILMVIISIESGLVKTITMEVTSDIPKSKLEETARILNERLQNLTLREINDTIGKRMRDVSGGDDQLIDYFVSSANKLFVFEDDHMHLSGAQNIVNQPEFADREKVHKILELLDNKKILIHVLNDTDSNDNITITIGKENKKELMKNCSLVVASYKIGSVSGTMGVIGPTRMYYPKMISIVDFIATEVNNLFKK